MGACKRARRRDGGRRGDVREAEAHAFRTVEVNSRDNVGGEGEDLARRRVRNAQGQAGARAKDRVGERSAQNVCFTGCDGECALEALGNIAANEESGGEANGREIEELGPDQGPAAEAVGDEDLSVRADRRLAGGRAVRRGRDGAIPAIAWPKLRISTALAAVVPMARAAATTIGSALPAAMAVSVVLRAVENLWPDKIKRDVAFFMNVFLLRGGYFDRTAVTMIQNREKNKSRKKTTQTSGR